MGRLSDVMDEAWRQRAEIQQQRADSPPLGLYLDQRTYLDCLSDPDVMDHAGYSAHNQGHVLTLAGMRVYMVNVDSEHVNVAAVSCST